MHHPNPAGLTECPVSILQDADEWLAFYNWVAHAVRPRRILEIGSFFGGSLWYWSRLPQRPERIVSVDLPIGPRDKRYQQMVTSRALWPGWLDGVDFHDFTTSSREPGTLAAVSALGPFDLVFIDGDHTSDGVRADWQAYGHLGAWAVFHDSHGIPEVARVVNEVRVEGFLTIDFVRPGGWGLTAVQRSAA